MKKKLNILFVLFVLQTLTFVPAQAAVTVKAKLDSAVLLMGNQTLLHLEILQDKASVGVFSNENDSVLTEAVEVASRLKADTVDLGNNRIQINKNILIQSFDSGAYVIPPFKYVVGKDTFASNAVSLKVVPVKVDSLKTVHDYKPVEEIPFNLFDMIPDFITDYWWLYLIVLLIAAAVLLFFFYKKKGTLPLLPKKPVIPPFEEAMMNLTQLKSQQLWQAGQEKEYYTKLTDILRNYIDRRFQINALEMTSNQIIQILKKNEEAKIVNDQLSQILEMADYVKFAKVRPLPDDNEAAYQRAVNFVTLTKPAEKSEEEKSDADNKKEDKKL